MKYLFFRRQLDTKNSVTPAKNTKTVTISSPSGQRITSFENEVNTSLTKPKKASPTSTNSSLNTSAKGPKDVRKLDIAYQTYNIHTIR